MKFSQPWYRKSRKAWFVTLDGKQIKLGKTKSEALSRFHELMAKPRTRTVRSDSLLGIIDAFLEWVQNNRSAATYEWYRYRLERFARQYPDMAADELRPFHVETWADRYPISRTSRRNYLRSVKRCMKWATKQGYIDKNPVENLEVPSGDHKEVYLPESEYEEMLRFVRSDDLRDLIVATWETGCRPQESLRVEARHVDVANQRWVFPRTEAKSKRMSRVIYLSDKALLITKRLMLAHPSGPLFRNSKGREWTSDAVNCAFDAIRVRMGKALMSQAGEEISKEAIEKLIPSLAPTRKVKGVERPKTASELCSEAKRKLTMRRANKLVPRYSLYALRHSWATNALQKGMDALTVAVLLGHTDPSQLSRTYQHLSLNPEHMLAQAKRAAG